MDAAQLELMKVLVVSLVQAETGKTNAQVERCVSDCQKLQEEINSVRSRVDFAEGAELKSKLNKLIESTQGLAVSDATQAQQIIAIYDKLDMTEEASKARETMNVTINATGGSADSSSIGSIKATDVDVAGGDIAKPGQ